MRRLSSLGLAVASAIAWGLADVLRLVKFALGLVGIVLGVFLHAAGRLLTLFELLLDAMAESLHERSNS